MKKSQPIGQRLPFQLFLVVKRIFLWSFVTRVFLWSFLERVCLLSLCFILYVRLADLTLLSSPTCGKMSQFVLISIQRQCICKFRNNSQPPAETLASWAPALSARCSVRGSTNGQIGILPHIPCMSRDSLPTHQKAFKNHKNLVCSKKKKFLIGLWCFRRDSLHMWCEIPICLSCAALPS